MHLIARHTPLHGNSTSPSNCNTTWDAVIQVLYV